MRARSILLVTTSLFTIAVPATAKPEDAAKFEHKPKAPGDRVALQFEETELGELVRFIGEMTGKRFVVASPKLAKVKASVYAAKDVSVAEAYQAFLAVLTANGLTLVPQAGFYKIVESQDVARQLTPLERGELPAEERYVTRIHRVAHLPAEEVATSILAKLQTKDASIVPYGELLIITETAANLRRMLEILAVVDQGTEDDRLFFRPIRHLPSTQVEKELNEMLALGKGAAAGPDRSAGVALHVARIVALERPNALVVVGTRASYERIAELLELVDVAPSNELKVQVVPLQHADAKKIVGPLNEALGGAAATGAPAAAGGGARGPAAAVTPPAALLEAQIKVSADESSNALIVTATPRDFVHVRAVIEALDKAKRQVFIEAAILDISAERGMDMGVAWHGGALDESRLGPPGQQTTYGGFRAPTSVMPSVTDLQAFALGVRGPEIPFAGIPGLSKIPSFGAFLRAVATSQGADILSTPAILASDNTPAELKVQLQTSLQPNAPTLTSLLGAGIPGAVPGSIPGLGSALPGSGGGVAASYKGIGPRVKVTPHLNDSNEVRLDVDEVISDIQNAPGPGDTFGTISYIERTATTTLTVKDGHTVVIGGLVRNRTARTETKVPILGDIPLLGALFRTRSDKTEKSNLVLILTPHIVRDEEDMRRIFERKMEERQELVDHDALFETRDWAPPQDWARTRGLLSDVQASYRAVARRKAEAAEIARIEAVAGHDASKALVGAPLELPIPQSGRRPARTEGSGPRPPAASGPRPAVVEH